MGVVAPFGMSSLQPVLCGVFGSCASGVGCLGPSEAELAGGGGEEVKRTKLDAAPGGEGFDPSRCRQTGHLSEKTRFGMLAVPYLACQLLWFWKPGAVRFVFG